MMEQFELDTTMEPDSTVRNVVRGAIKDSVEVFRGEVKARSGHEAFGLMAEAEMKLQGIVKTMKKAMAKMLETLDTGVNTPAELSRIAFIAEEMAQEAILMAMTGKICVDWLTFQERAMNDVDPETGEIRR